MDFTNVRTESQSGPSSLRGRAGGGRTQASQWQEQCSAESTPPPGCLPAASEPGVGGALAGSQGSPVNLCLGLAMSP